MAPIFTGGLIARDNLRRQRGYDFNGNSDKLSIWISLRDSHRDFTRKIKRYIPVTFWKTVLDIIFQFGMAKMGETYDNRIVHFHSSAWSGKHLAKISQIDWCLYWNQSLYHYMHCNFRKRVKQCGSNRVGRTVSVWIRTTMILGELNRLDGRASTSLDLSNTVSHSFRQLMDIIWNLNTCLTLNEKFARQKPIYKRSATSEFCGKSYVLSKRHRLYKQKTDRQSPQTFYILGHTLEGWNLESRIQANHLVKHLTKYNYFSDLKSNCELYLQTCNTCAKYEKSESQNIRK